MLVSHRGSINLLANQRLCSSSVSHIWCIRDPDQTFQLSTYLASFVPFLTINLYLIIWFPAAVLKISDKKIFKVKNQRDHPEKMFSFLNDWLKLFHHYFPGGIFPSFFLLFLKEVLLKETLQPKERYYIWFSSNILINQDTEGHKPD